MLLGTTFRLRTLRLPVPCWFFMAIVIVAYHWRCLTLKLDSGRGVVPDICIGQKEPRSWKNEVVATHIFWHLFGEDPHFLTNIVERGWNHHLVQSTAWSPCFWCREMEIESILYLQFFGHISNNSLISNCPWRSHIFFPTNKHNLQNQEIS